MKQRKPQWARTVLIAIIVVCVFDWSVQCAGLVGSVNATSAQRTVADYLRDHFDPNSDARIFSDEGTVTVMSGIPEQKFLTSSDAPRDRQTFLSYLKEKNVEYLVFVSKEDSTPAKLFPELKNPTTNEAFEPVMHSRSRFLRMEIWLYRVRGSGRVPRP